MKTFHNILLLAALMCAAPSAAQVSGAAGASRLLFGADSLRVTLVLTEGRSHGSQYAVWDTPYIATAAGDTLRLGAAVFRGRRNSRYVARQRYFAGDASRRSIRRLTAAPLSYVQPSSREAMLGDTLRYTVTIARSQRPWMWRQPVTLGLRREREGCCSVADIEGGTLATARYVEPFVPSIAAVADNTGKAGELQRANPVLHHMSEYRPYTRDRILRKESGALYVHFQLDRSELRHDFRSNAPTLDRIVDITRQIMADTTSAVKKIQIVGLASVEGSASHNERLAAARGDALKRYIQARVHTPDSLYEVANGGEAWTELRSQIADTVFAGRDAMLRIIDNTPDPALRERRIKALDGGRPYAWVRDNLLSEQRNSGYLRIYYDYVPDNAARTINRATELIAGERYADALQMLQAVKGDPRAHNALGVALYMTGERAEAMLHFRKAADLGNREAQDNIANIEKYK